MDSGRREERGKEREKGFESDRCVDRPVEVNLTGCGPGRMEGGRTLLSIW